MLGNLLIIRENGRSAGTYGVNRNKVNNMRIAFLCMVILLLCNVRASYEFQFYPDSKFELSRESVPRGLESTEDLPYPSYLYRRSYYEPEDNENESDVYENMPEKILKLKQMVQKSAAKLRALAARKSRLKFKLPSIEDADLEPFISFDKLQRPDNDDFISRGLGVDDEDDPETGRTFVKLDNILGSNEYDGGLVAEASGKQPSNDDKIEDEDVQFAYKPGDSRFYKTTSRTGFENPLNSNFKIPEVVTYNPLKDINVKVRNDEERIKSSEVTEAAESRTDANVNIVPLKSSFEDGETAGVYIIAVVAGISAAATVALIAFGIGWYNLQKHVKNASDVEYPAYGVTGPNKEISPSGDRRLAQSAQMYHYQHQKQQIIAMESRAAANDRHGSVSEADSDEENEEGDYTVYECPGLAPTGEMEVKNPLFQDDPTPAQTPAVKSGEDVQRK